MNVSQTDPVSFPWALGWGESPAFAGLQDFPV